MDNTYKQILLAIVISLCCASTLSLSADLLNGPWSPESQELAKVLQDKTLQIPDKFKGQDEPINLIRNAIDKSQLATKYTTKTLELIGLMVRDSAIFKLIKNNPVFLEATIQIIKQEGRPDTLANIAELARMIKNVSLFTDVVKTASEETRNEILGSYTMMLFVKASRVSDQTISLDEYNTLKDLIKIIFNNSKKTEAYKAMLNSIRVYFKNMKDPVDFLLSFGLPLNLVLENNQTLLDKTYSLLSDIPPFKAFPDEPQKNIEYLKSKGAKTYAELTASEKVQK